jgi:predicted transcriptional regulator
MTATKEEPVPLSKPMKLICLRLDEDEKARLQELAAERNLTLSYVLREGARLYLEDRSAMREADPSKVRLRAT